MHTASRCLLIAVLTALAVPALAQTTSPYAVNWSSLNPGNDWAAQVLNSLFPISASANNASGFSTGNESTVIGQLVGQFTGFVGAIACLFVCYTTLTNIHRAAETARALGSNQSWMFVARLGFAGVMMFPINGGFSAGQALVMQGAQLGIGMAGSLYNLAIQAIGPDAGLIDSELCMDLINLASGTSSMVPIPQPVTGTDPSGNGYVTWRYSLSTGDESGNPVCGTVTVQNGSANQVAIAGVTVNMSTIQQGILINVLNGTIRTPVQSVAQSLWQNRTAASLVPLQAVFVNATNAYTTALTTAATGIQSSIASAWQQQAAQARAGQTNLLPGQQQQSTLGWTAAGAYYLEIARLNATTLSLLNATPVTTSPTFEGLGYWISEDLAPVETAAKAFMDTLARVVQTTDSTTTPTAIPPTQGDPKQSTQGANAVTSLFGSLGFSNYLLSSITNYLLPQTQVWTDPFGSLMGLGQFLVNASLIAFGTSALLASTSITTAGAIWNFLTGNWGAAAAEVAGHALMSFLATPIFFGLSIVLIQGLIIAYVLPMIPWVMWMAGVCGWIVLVCEAMIAVPLWMLAHMTAGGDGLHGRAIEGWGLLFNVVFRPSLMVIGLFLGYFVFDCMSWLIRE